MAIKKIELNGEQFIIRNIGFVFGHFDGEVYRYRPERKIFKYQHLGHMCFKISAYGNIEQGIFSKLNKMLDEEHREKETQRKIQEFEKTLDKQFKL